jgi:hypothetical protein
MLAFENKFNAETNARLARGARIEKRTQELYREQQEFEARSKARAAARAAKEAAK